MSTNEQDFVRALIEMYRSLPCLWKIKSKDYSNRYMKREAYEKLVAVYREYHPTETVDENIVRKKIQALRTVFKKEVNKVENSKKSGAGTEEVYVPRLWYYDLMAFTRDQEIPRPCQTVTSLCEPSPEDILPESPDDHVPLQQRETTEANNVQSPQSSITLQLLILPWDSPWPIEKVRVFVPAISCIITVPSRTQTFQTTNPVRV
ncbi:uncharacterized protein [Ranitomeya imitator]|uniref:uncharacterized protein n=1 Tax=Ranitomeya imitator TaxID=111125 RepID=UPI0037E7209B